jgi:prepilin-type N-terminal cleavage/methylation domain-containing protein
MLYSVTNSRPPGNKTRGFTLIELMIVVVILAIFAALAVPTFIDFRERSTVRGAANEFSAAVAVARMEAAKRNDYVTVSVRGSGAAWCVGVQQGTTGCNCLSGTCDVQTIDSGTMRGARLAAAASFNGSTDFSIDPRLNMLSDPTAAASITVRSPSDSWDYRIQVNLSATAQTDQCMPSTSKHQISGIPGC